MKIMNKILHSVFEVIYTAGAVQTQREDVRFLSANRPKGAFGMIQKVKILGVQQIKALVDAACGLDSDVGVHDANGEIADAKSILGILRLDYSRPVQIVSENERALRICVRAVTA